MLDSAFPCFRGLRERMSRVKGVGRFVVLVAVVIAALGAMMWTRRAPEAAADPQRLTYIATAQQQGVVGYRDPVGAISSDGRTLAFAEGRRLYEQPLGGGASTALAVAEGQIRHLVPDGLGAWIFEDTAAGARWWLASCGLAMTPAWRSHVMVSYVRGLFLVGLVAGLSVACGSEGSDGGEGGSGDGAGGPGSTGSSAKSSYQYQLQRVEVISDAAGKEAYQVKQFTFNLNVPMSSVNNPGVTEMRGVGMGTELTLREGENAVVGTANVGGSDEAVIVVVTARKVK